MSHTLLSHSNGHRSAGKPSLPTTLLSIISVNLRPSMAHRSIDVRAECSDRAHLVINGIQVNRCAVVESTAHSVLGLAVHVLVDVRSQKSKSCTYPIANARPKSRALLAAILHPSPSCRPAPLPSHRRCLLVAYYVPYLDIR